MIRALNFIGIFLLLYGLLAVVFQWNTLWSLTVGLEPAPKTEILRIPSPDGETATVLYEIEKSPPLNPLWKLFDYGIIALGIFVLGAAKFFFSRRSGS